MLAAQLYEKVKKEVPDMDSLIAKGDFMPLTKWLGKNIHSKGRLYGFDDLVKNATGAALSPAPLLKHLEGRYLQA